MHIPPYTAVDTDDHSYAVDMRATVIDLLSHPKHNQQAMTKHETDQIFILGYN